MGYKSNLLLMYYKSLCCFLKSRSRPSSPGVSLVDIDFISSAISSSEMSWLCFSGCALLAVLLSWLCYCRGSFGIVILALKEPY